MTACRSEAAGIVRPVIHDPILATLFRRLFARLTEAIPDLLAVGEELQRLLVYALRRHGAEGELRRAAASPPLPRTAILPRRPDLGEGAMTMKLEAFAAACKSALKSDPGPAGREKVCALVRDILKDREFVRAHIHADGPERAVLYEDPELGFTILAHSYHGAQNSTPHDHGPTWAIYGQASGVTTMTDWECLARPSGNAPGKARRIRDYELTPGMACLYEPGALHSPRRDDATTLLRIEGMNLAHIKRRPYVAVETTTSPVPG